MNEISNYTSEFTKLWSFRNYQILMNSPMNSNKILRFSSSFGHEPRLCFVTVIKKKAKHFYSVPLWVNPYKVYKLIYKRLNLFIILNPGNTYTNKQKYTFLHNKKQDIKFLYCIIYLSFLTKLFTWTIDCLFFKHQQNNGIFNSLTNCLDITVTMAPDL